MGKIKTHRMKKIYIPATGPPVPIAIGRPHVRGTPGEESWQCAVGSWQLATRPVESDEGRNSNGEGSWQAAGWRVFLTAHLMAEALPFYRKADLHIRDGTVVHIRDDTEYLYKHSMPPASGLAATIAVGFPEGMTMSSQRTEEVLPDHNFNADRSNDAVRFRKVATATDNVEKENNKKEINFLNTVRSNDTDPEKTGQAGLKTLLTCRRAELLTTSKRMIKNET